MTYLARDVFTTLAQAVNLMETVAPALEEMGEVDYLARRDGILRDTKDDGFSCCWHPDIQAIAAEEGSDTLGTQVAEWLVDGKFGIPGQSPELNELLTAACMELAESFLDVDIADMARQKAAANPALLDAERAALLFGKY